MLSIITYKNIPEQIEIVADTEGINELFEYLESVMISKDHMHLITSVALSKIKFL